MSALWKIKHGLSTVWDNWNIENFSRQQIYVEEGTGGLKRILSVWHLIGFGIASTIGAGIFVTSGEAAQHAGTGLALSFVLSGFGAFLSALAYAEYASKIPVSGSAYSFTYASLGEAFAWFIGWNMTLEYCVSAGAVAQGWAGYLVSALRVIFPKIEIPVMLHGYYIGNTGITFSPLALSIIVVCTIVLFFGLSESAAVNVSMAVINIIIIVFVIGAGAYNFNVDNWNNFMGEGQSWNGLEGVLRGSSLVFFSFIGFDATATLASEADNPAKSLPISIIATLSVTTSLYCAVSVVLNGMVTKQTLDATAPLSSAFINYNMKYAVIIVSIGSVTTLSATVLASLMGQPRIFYRMAKDGLLFPIFGWVNSRGVITFGTIFTGFIAGGLALLNDLPSLTDMISAGTLLAYSAVNAGMIMTRYDRYVVITDACYVDTQDYSFSRLKKLERLAEWIYYKIKIMLLLFAIGTFMIGICLRNSWHISIPIIISFFLILILLCLCLLREVNPPPSFRCPFVPVVPLGGITINMILLAQLPVEAAYRILVWTVIGFCIYMFYGVHYSKATKLEREGTEEILLKTTRV